MSQRSGDEFARRWTRHGPEHGMPSGARYLGSAHPGVATCARVEMVGLQAFRLG
jgi:hypothetical protein